jgi:glutamate dehydrogenase
VESFITAIDSYEPTRLPHHEDAFRVLARFISRNIDARYLERHPPKELLPDIEQLMCTMMVRRDRDITVTLQFLGHGQSKRAVLMTCMPDQLFIFSTVRGGLEALGLRTYRSISTVVPVQRTADGEIQSLGAADADKESFIFMEVDGDDLPGRAQQIEQVLQDKLRAVQLVVQDFSAIQQAVKELATSFDAQSQRLTPYAQAYADNARLLRWLVNEHFVFMGVKYLPAPSQAGAPRLHQDLGIGRPDCPWPMQIEPSELETLLAGDLPPFLVVRKSRTDSWMYRAGRTDHLMVQCFDPNQQPMGIMVIEGLFSYPALAEPRTSVPILDRVIEELYIRLKATKGSHRYRTIRNAFNSLPLEYLFALPKEDVHKLVEQVLEVDADHRLQVHISLEEPQAVAFIFVALPRSHYSDELRSDLRRLLKERFCASAVDDGVYAGNFESVTFHYYLTGMTPLDAAGERALIDDIEMLASPWAERLGDELTRLHDKKTARRLFAAYTDAFPNRYREETSIARAALDIEMLEDLSAEQQFDCDIYKETSDRPSTIARLRMFQTHNLLLSDILPILDNFGLVIIDQFPTPIHVPQRGDRLINTFRIGGVQGMTCDLTTRRSRLRNAINAVICGAMSNDPLNRLLLRADIPWPSVVLVLAYVAYARQIGLPYDDTTVQEALLTHSDVVRSLTEMFRAKFDPTIEGQSATVVDERRMQLCERTRRAVLLQLDAVDDLASDQVLRTLYNLIDATVRTNFYARDLHKEHHLVLKLDPAQITRMPEPRPYREIFVFHPEVAGLHLRGGPIARGGIRWSDRLLDFRTEVLGLAATQNLKNVLIVPRGAKGAFILRNPPADLQARRAHADAMYRVFIGGLLDVTDNLIKGEPVSPPKVLAWDGHDHYLVVAADKGTAHLSDTANQLALDRGFWLGDAFASGGSKGYDHKKEAITSRGAWACVTRHFKELGMHPDTDPIRVVGIGDMSGDVFGNGMLRSSSMLLVAAFDHRNIFLDPNPDAKASYQHRQALFAKPRSSWEDYPKEAISAGGGIYPRHAKTIKLSAQAQKMLDVTASQMSGPELVQAILKAPVDLLWNGGIGTYIKSSQETHLDVGDPANDAVRVDALEVRARVLGEGGNLGVTAAGRIELAGRGMRLNTDAVDNSAGVDMSDHEVNLKILFRRAQENGTLAPQDRDSLLESLTDEVGKQCVRNNWLQSRMLSLDEIRSRKDSARFQRAVAFLSERVPFKRRDANLPGERITKMRTQKGEGFYRPELAVLAANAKLDLRQEFHRASEAFSVDSLREHLHAYFSDTLRKRFAQEIDDHPLGAHIARMMLVNAIINDAGVSWLPETTIMTGRSTEDIMQAYFGASALIEARMLKGLADDLSTHLDTATEYRLRLRIEDAIETVCTWLLRQSSTVDASFNVSFPEALAAVPKLVGLVDPLQNELAPHAVAPQVLATIGALSRIDDVLDVALLASSTRTPVDRAAAAYFMVGQRSGVYPLVRNALESQSGEDLDRPARFALRGRLRDNLLAVTGHVLSQEANIEHLSEGTALWLDALGREMAPLDGGESPVCNLVVANERLLRRTLSR